MSDHLLRIAGLQKFYGAKLILDDVGLNLKRGDRAVLVGENGVGKSTLARLILGREEFERGEIQLAANVQLGYLPQEVRVDSGITVELYIAQRVGEHDMLRQRLGELEAQMEVGETYRDGAAGIWPDSGAL